MSTSTPHQPEAQPGTLRAILKSQYHAGLAMLRECVERCPDDLWYDTRPANAFWQVAYHTLYFTHLYLQPSADAFEPWAHQTEAQHPDGIPGRADPASPLALIPTPYSQAEVLAYWHMCQEMADAWVDAIDLNSPDSGFSWYPISKLEHQLVNIRHLQHHTAQLADRLRAAAGVGIRWVGAGEMGAHGREQRPAGMLKFVVVLYRRPELTPEAFFANLRDEHGPTAERLPGLRRYVQNHVRPDPTRAHPGWDAVVELYWDDRASMEAAWASPEGQAATDHLNTLADLSRTTWSVVEEHVRR